MNPSNHKLRQPENVLNAFSGCLNCVRNVLNGMEWNVCSLGKRQRQPENERSKFQRS
ncbi:hypothetical protein [Kingella oralis]